MTVISEEKKQDMTLKGTSSISLSQCCNRKYLILHMIVYCGWDGSCNVMHQESFLFD